MAYALTLKNGRIEQIQGRVKPLGYVQITDLSASAELPNIPDGAVYAVITAEAQAVRYRDDGTDPTAAIGMPLAAGASLTYAGDLAAIKFIQQVAGGILNIAYYG